MKFFSAIFFLFFFIFQQQGFSQPEVKEIEKYIEKDQLFLKFENAPDLSAKLVHWHYDTWEINWDKIHAWFDFGTIQFHYTNNMKIMGFEFDVPNYDIFFDELKVTKSD